MFKPFYKKKDEIKIHTTKYLQSIDEIFADTTILENIEIDTCEIDESILHIRKRWWSCF
jgi:lipid II:glycine glycyltransferase (peptidoglycan interpeptide bridge formation enzyme)